MADEQDHQVSERLKEIQELGLEKIGIDFVKLAKSVGGIFFRVVLSTIWRLCLFSTFAIGFALAVYLILRTPDNWRGEIGSGITFVIVGIFVVFAAYSTALIFACIHLFQEIGLGKLVFDNLIGRVIGAKSESVEEAYETSHSADGLTQEQLRDWLHLAANDLIQKTGADLPVPGPVKWMTRKVMSIGTWGVVKVILTVAGKEVDGERKFSIDGIRSVLGSRIDDELCGQVKDNVNSNTRFILVVPGILCVAVAIGIRMLFD